MRKHKVTLMLGAGVIAATGSLSVAQMQSDTNVDSDRQQSQQRQTTDRPTTLTTDRSSDHDESKKKSVTGTVVLLEEYLKHGDSASEQATPGRSSMGQTRALLSDDGEVYIILGMHDAQRPRMGGDADRPRRGRGVGAMQSDQATDRSRADRSRAERSRADRSRIGGQSQADRSTSDAGATAAQRTDRTTDQRQDPTLSESPGYEMDDQDQARQSTARQRSSGATDQDQSPTLSESPGYEMDDQNARTTTRQRTTDATDRDQSETLSESPGYEMDNQDQARQSSDRTARTGVQDDMQDDQSQVYGMADSSDRRSSRAMMRLGQKVELTGYVYEREDIHGMRVVDVQPAQE